MVKVKLIKPTPGGAGTIRAGTIIEVSESEAALLVKSGNAVAVVAEPKKKR